MSVALSAWHVFAPESQAAPTEQVPGLAPQQAWPTLPHAAQVRDWQDLPVPQGAPSGWAVQSEVELVTVQAWQVSPGLVSPSM
jgi:hypothetical protein